MEMVQDLVMWGLGILATGLLTISTTYIKRLEGRTTENFAKISASFDKLSDIVSSHDRHLATLKTAQVVDTLNSHSIKLTELSADSRYQQEALRGLVTSVRELVKDVAQVSGDVERISQTCAIHLGKTKQG